MLRAVCKRLLLCSCFWVFAAPQLFAAESAPAPETQKEKESYSVGYQVGMSMKTDGVDVNFDKLIQGLQDAINDKEPRLSTDEMKTLIVDLKKRAREVQMRKIQEQIVENAKESEKFLEGNREKEGVKTTGSGLQYKILKEGEGASPAPEDYVKVSYRGTFIDGKEFDNSYDKGEPARVKVGGVIRGWTEALAIMKPGAKWQLFVPPSLAYGRNGLSNRIPPNKVLVFELELVAVEKGDQAVQSSDAQPAQTHTVRKTNLTGEIAKSKHGYIIRSRRGNAPSEIYTIRNPEPNILDEFVKSEKTVSIEVGIVSGDNVNIEKIDGKEYRSGTQ